MTAKRLEGCRCGTIGDVHFAITSTATDQQAGFIRAVLEEAQIAYGSIVHGQFDFFALELLLLFIVAHKFYRFVIGSGGDEITLR